MARATTTRTRMRIYRRGLGVIMMPIDDGAPITFFRRNRINPLFNYINNIGFDANLQTQLNDPVHTLPATVPITYLGPPTPAPTPIPANGPLPPGAGYQQIEAPGNPYPYVYIGTGTNPAPPPPVTPANTASTVPNIYFDQNYQQWVNQLTGQIVDPTTGLPINSAGISAARSGGSQPSSGFSLDSAISYVKDHWIWFAGAAGAALLLRGRKK